MTPQLGAGFEWVDTAGGRALVCAPLQSFAPHLFTTRHWALGSADGDAGSTAGWAAVAAALGLAPDRLARLHQVHGASVVVRRSGTSEPSRSREPAFLPDADIITTDDPDRAVAIQTADCVPILIADTRTGAVAAAHAGWRGLAAGVPRVVVTAMADAFGSRPADLVAAIGPSISAEQYEVGEDVLARFEASDDARGRLEAWFPARTRPGHWLFDGWASAGDQLENAGVPKTRVFRAASCTALNADLFCSYRRDGRRAGRMAAAIRSRAR